MAVETNEFAEIQRAARDLWEMNGDPGNPKSETTAAAIMRSEFRRLTEAGYSGEEIKEAIGGELLELPEDPD